MISIRNLSKRFGELVVLKDVNAEISKGEVISIIGPSGTGKSTFLRCINLLDKPTGGEIIIDGINLLDKKTNVHKLRQKMGMVFQSFNLFSHLMVIENVMLAPIHLLKMSRRQAFDEGMRQLETVGLAQKSHSYPDELSGGQKQRVAIARALAMRPEIVLFDEPTSSLDPTMVSEVLAVLRKLASDGMTMMIVTHEMKFARDVSTRVFYMDDGIILEEGPPEQIFEHQRKEKTRTFIRKIRTYVFEIRSRSFDLYGLNAGIEEFGRRQFLQQKQIYNVQLVIEELVVNKLLARQGETVDITITVSYSEVNSEVELVLEYAGEPYDPFHDMADEDDLSMIIVSKLVRSNSISMENGRNRLKLTF